MSRADSMQWVELHGADLIGMSVEFAIETLHADGFKVMVSSSPRPADFPAPSGDRVYLNAGDDQVVKVEAQ